MRYSVVSDRESFAVELEHVRFRMQWHGLCLFVYFVCLDTPELTHSKSVTTTKREDIEFHTSTKREYMFTYL